MADSAIRIRNILIITRRLVIMALVILAIIGTMLYISYSEKSRLMLTWLCFGCGIIGGFVSIKQRLNKIGDVELIILSNSWFSVILIPVYGGIFALVLYVLFLSGLIKGSLFPEFYMPLFHDPPLNSDISDLLEKTNPLKNIDLPKFIFWSFVAGFSERLVPQIIQSVVNQYDKDEDQLDAADKDVMEGAKKDPHKEEHEGGCH